MLRKRRQAVLKLEAVVVPHAVARRVKPRHQRGVRRKRQRGDRDRLRAISAFSRELIEVGGQAVVVSVGPETIGAGGLHRNEDEIRLPPGGNGRGWAHRSAGKGGWERRVRRGRRRARGRGLAPAPARLVVRARQREPECQEQSLLHGAFPSQRSSQFSTSPYQTFALCAFSTQ